MNNLHNGLMHEVSTVKLCILLVTKALAEVCALLGACEIKLSTELIFC